MNKKTVHFFLADDFCQKSSSDAFKLKTEMVGITNGIEKNLGPVVQN